MEATPTVYIVDDDAAVRDSLRFLIRSVGLNAETFASSIEFLDQDLEDRAGCLILDVRMAGMSGLELQEKLRGDGVRLPVIIITGHADVPMAVRAIKSGAVEFIQKPFNDQVLLDHVHRALACDKAMRQETREWNLVCERVSQLTTREQQVMQMVVGGFSNRLMATELGLSEKTIEVHRARVMSKMGAASVAELVRQCMLYERGRDGQPS
jgi:two-component system, LuxR family, response regulator FixJ